MTRATLVQVPYHLGRSGVGPALGVPILAEALADERSETVAVEVDREPANEIAGSMAVVRELAATVQAASGLPIVLAGNCNSSLGTVTGLGGGIGVVWLDAHGDFNTPETTATGFFDGMGLAMLTGSGWAGVRDGLESVPEEHVVHVGGRDFDPAEQERLERSAVTLVRRPPADEALDRLREGVRAVYVHVDLDVLDPSVGRANRLATPDGLSVEDVAETIDAVAARFEIRAAGLTWYEPDGDPERAIPVAVRAIYERLLASVPVAA